MYISLLMKMFNGFSWPAKIMVSTFNFVLNFKSSLNLYLHKNMIMINIFPVLLFEFGRKMCFFCSQTYIINFGNEKCFQATKTFPVLLLRNKTLNFNFYWIKGSQLGIFPIGHSWLLPWIGTLLSYKPEIVFKMWCTVIDNHNNERCICARGFLDSNLN